MCLTGTRAAALEPGEAAMKNKTVAGITVLLLAWVAFGTMGFFSDNFWHSCVKPVCVCAKNDMADAFHKESLRSLAEGPVDSRSQVSCDTATKEFISSKYNAVATTAGDIHEHIPVIYRYVEMFLHATEIGVRNLGSSWAFAKAGMDRVAAGKSFTYRASDITKQGVVEQLDKTMSGCPSIEYSFIEGDDLLIEPWKTNVLLIDTWHVYRQLAAELPRWAPFVGHYIMLHDTQSFRVVDEGVEGHGGKAVDEGLFSRTGNQGLWPAVEQFISAHPEWSIHEHRENNNGLTILKRADTTPTGSSHSQASCDTATKEFISSKYNAVATTASDIHEHIPVIYRYVEMFLHATEIGVRNLGS